MEQETRDMLKKILSIINAQQGHCDKRMKSSGSQHAREIWGCCALTCDVIAAHVEQQLDMADQREAAAEINEKLHKENEEKVERVN